MDYDVIIIGGGASGLTCAIEAGRRGRKAAILEHSPKIGQKILISGGGRCNFTNLNISSKNYSSSNPDFCRSALARFTPEHFTALLDKHRIKFYEKEMGQLFCEKSSKEIVSMLKAECEKSGVKIFLDCKVKSITKHNKFSLETGRGEFSAASLVIATGGLSYKDLGASDFGYAAAKQFGHSIVRCRPSLVPLVFSKTVRPRFSGLSGISLNVSSSFKNRTFKGGMLFTRKGLSGPAILQTSLAWDGKNSVIIDLLPDLDILTAMKEAKCSGCKIILKNYLGRFLPNRLASALVDNESKRLCDISGHELAGIADKLHNWEIKPAGTEGYDVAEVTAGGIDTNEISSKTFESKKINGLYLIGEVLDVTGELGGYNLHWAWASGFAAGQFA
ncbi:MAG: NAD(P)/FAD-dependent oxidoreductase [Deltaproteobacteria bacterium]|nr:NAD(P)/FAD-dependent oxidoreductase [Deltaproteobacteria bacterium]